MADQCREECRERCQHRQAVWCPFQWKGRDSSGCFFSGCLFSVFSGRTCSWSCPRNHSASIWSCWLVFQVSPRHKRLFYNQQHRHNTEHCHGNDAECCRRLGTTCRHSPWRCLQGSNCPRSLCGEDAGSQVGSSWAEASKQPQCTARQSACSKKACSGQPIYATAVWGRRDWHKNSSSKAEYNRQPIAETCGASNAALSPQ
jgi:hypothetical protein